MPLTETVRLDIRQAEAAIAAIRADVSSLTSTQTIDVDIDVDEAPLRTMDERFDSIERNVADVNREVADIAVSARSSSVEFEQMARALGVSEDEARQLADEILSADRAARQIDDSARDIARQLGLADDDARRFASEMAKANRETRQTDQAMDRVAAGARRLRLAIIGAVAAFGVRGLVRGAGEAIESFNNLNESANAVNVIFEEGADTVLKFGENSARSTLLARSSFQQLVVPIGALLRNFGFDAQQAADASVVLTQRAADLASVFNTDVAEALTAIQAALRGEADPLERFGASITAARVEAFALAEGLAASKGEITDAIRLQARYQLILEDTARAQGDVARTADDPANAARRLAAEAENARAALGEALIPAYLEILRVTPDVIAAFEDIGPAVETLATSIAASADGIAAFATGTLEVLARLPAATELILLNLEQSFRNAAGTFLPFADLVFDINELNDELAETETLAARIGATEAELNLITSIQAGVDPAQALTAALLDTAAAGADVEERFEALARISGLSGGDLTAFVRNVVNNAGQLGLSAGQIEFFRFQLALLIDELGTPEVFFRPEDIVPGIEQATDAVDDGIVSLRELRVAAAEAGVSISEAFGSDLFEDDTTFSGLARVEAAVEGFRDRINAIGATIDPMQGAAEAVELSIDEFLANITAQFEQSAEFELALSRLGAAGFDALEETLRQLGPGAVGLVEGFLEDTASARVAEDVLDPAANDFADKIESSFRESVTGIEWDKLVGDAEAGIVAAFTRENFSRLGEEEVRNIARGLESPAALTETAFAGESIAEEIAGGFAGFFDQNADGLGFDASSELARALTSGEGAAAAEQAGIDWAALFSRAVAANVSFDFAPPTGTTSSPTAPAGTDRAPQTAPSGVTGTTVYQEINTTPERESTDVARATQLAGVVAHNIRSF